MSMSSFLATIRLHGQYPFNVKIDALNTSMASSIAEATYGKGSVFLMQGYDLTSEGLSDIASRSKSSSASSSSSDSYSSSSSASSSSPYSSSSTKSYDDGELSGFEVSAVLWAVIGVIVGPLIGAIFNGSEGIFIGAVFGFLGGFYLGLFLPYMFIIVPVILGFIAIVLVIAIVCYVLLHPAGAIATVIVSGILYVMVRELYVGYSEEKKRLAKLNKANAAVFVHNLGYHDDKVWFKVATFTLSQKKITNKMLQKKFRIGAKYVHSLVNLMEDEGIVSKENAKGERIVLKKFND